MKRDHKQRNKPSRQENEILYSFFESEKIKARLQTVERDPARLRESRIKQLVDFAVSLLNELGEPTNFGSFVQKIYIEARLRFHQRSETSRDYAEVAALEALRRFRERKTKQPRSV